MVNRLRTAAVQALVLLVVVSAGWAIAQAIDTRITAEDVRNMREAAARQAGHDFLDHYVEGDGRVVRRDEGNDVVSEGQAYGMLIAVALGDEARFRAIWDWTKSHLRRPDGLLSWRWADGQVTDVNSVADADLDAARSLVLAGRRFQAPELGEDGKRLGADILQAETVAVGTRTAPPDDLAPPGEWVVGPGRMTVAGNWASAPPYAVDPGYFAPRAERELLHVSADRRWLEVSRTQRVLGWQLVGTGPLPPDWATVNEVGHAVPTGPPTGGSAWVALGRIAGHFTAGRLPGQRRTFPSPRWITMTTWRSSDAMCFCCASTTFVARNRRF
jgi:endoglucanase